jgi:protein SCO1
MNASPKSLQRMVWGSMAITIVAIVVAFVISRQRNSKETGSSPAANQLQAGKSLPVLFQVPDFSLTNQNGKIVSATDLRGKVWLADIIFTSCAGPCPEMTRRMADLQASIVETASFKLVTLTTHPEVDTPAVLAAYGRRFQADAERWHFLTGSKKQIVDLAIGGLKFTSIEKEPAQQENPNDLFIHSTLFVLVDKQGRARGLFENEDPEMKPKVLWAVAQLLGEN